ncbi:hypothetical protein [Clostridium thermarum]|uniref:hypothetical protein n=1 Tax=Clostridium thermarum TaxID=1716543 RepID=UPI0013D5AB87|nr:hypothetical protein [Clostridium thermarum]
MENVLKLDINHFEALSFDELTFVEGGGLIREIFRTAFGVAGGIVGGVATFSGVTAACTPTLTPFGAGIVGAACVPGGAASGFATVVGAFDFFFPPSK